jgi:TRAP transporter TAXI family solute receptor
MKAYVTLTLVITTIVSFFTLVSPAAAARTEDKFVTIGTGSVTGVYYPTGGAICRLVNRERRTHGIRCSVESSGGSVYNLEALRKGDLDLAIAQSDWQFNAYNGVDYFVDQGANKKIRALFSLHSEVFTVVARADSGIKKIEDLVGKRINVGNKGSGNRATMEVLMKAEGWTNKDFKSVLELKASEQPEALCNNKIDVMIYSAGHPNGAVQEAATSCETVIVPVEGAKIDKLLKDNPYYAYTVIPGGMYAGTPNNVKTFGVKATLVTSSDVDEELIYQVVKAVFDNFDNFKTLHPVFATLDPKKMALEGNTAPLHKGAERYFKEKNMLSN